MKRYISALAVACMLATSVADAGSIGRSGGGGGRSSSSSFSHSSSSSSSKSSSFSQPSKPAVAPAPATPRPGGIGGNSASVGVRKSEVTNSVRNDVALSKPSPTNPNAGKSGSFGSSPSPSYTPSPSYGYATPPAPTVSNGSTFMSSLGGSFAGTVLGNALFGNHGHGGGTTVINNGTPSVSNSGSIQSGPSAGSVDNQFNPGGVSVQPKKEYTVWSFIADLIGFVFVVAILLGIAWLFYKGFQMVRNYVNKERGVSNTPFSATQRFWEIQKAFSAADVTTLQKLLGPDVVDEFTMNIQPSPITIKNVSHEVRLQNASEFSVWYKFYETDGSEINQVWHYEKFGKEWKLNGIENV